MSKKEFALLFLLSSAMFTSANDCPEVSFTGAREWYPISYYEDDNLNGVAPALIRAALSGAAMTVTATLPRPFKRSMFEVETGLVDAMAGVYFTQERADQYIYSDPIATDEIRVFVLQGRQFSLTKLKDLEDKKGLRPIGGSYGEAFDDYANRHLNFEGFEHMDSAIKILDSGRAHYIVLALQDGLKRLRGTPFENRLVPLPFVVATNDIHVVFSRESSCKNLVQKFNQGLEKLKKEGRYADIVETYSVN